MKFRIRRTILCVVLLAVCLSGMFSLNQFIWVTETFTMRKHQSLLVNEFYFAKTLIQNTSAVHPNTTSKSTSVSLQKNVTSLECGDVIYPVSLLRREHWAPVDTVVTLYVYSGYVNVKGRGIVTIVGAKTSVTNSYYCQLWYRGSSDNMILDVVPASLNRYHSSKEKYVANEVTCNLKDKRVPESVSVVDSICGTPLNHILLHKGPPLDVPRYNFTVCTAPLSIRYGRAYELVEWIELNRLLGADRFIFYNYDIRPNVARVLEEYSKRGLAEVLPWDIPLRVHTWPRSSKPDEIQYFGQTAQLNECLLRCKLNSKYLVNIDLDEFPIPHKENTSTWAELIQSLPHSSVYIFRSAFFRKEWEATHVFPGIEVALNYTMVTLLKTLREAKTWPPRQRSKYIARTSSTIKLQVHDASGTEKLSVVDPKYGLLHHYRNWLKYNDTTSKLDDRTVVNKYKDTLIDRVLDMWSNLRGVELDIPI